MLCKEINALTKQLQCFYQNRRRHYSKINAEKILRTPGTWDTLSVLKQNKKLPDLHTILTDLNAQTANSSVKGL